MAVGHPARFSEAVSAVRRTAQWCNAAAEATVWMAQMGMVLVALVACALLLDRREPLTLAAPLAPVVLDPGHAVRVPLQVRVGVSRQCAADLAPELVDSAGVRYPLAVHALASRDVLALGGRHTAELVLRVTAPAHVAPGAAELTVDIQWRCNRLHALWPVGATLGVPVTVPATDLPL